MADEKFLNDSNVSALWNKVKEYIQDNTAMVGGGLTIELDEEVFGEPPYTLEFEVEEDDENSGGGGQLKTLEITEIPDKTDYFLDEQVDTAGMVLTGEFNNNVSANIISGYKVSPAVITEPGEQNIKISALGKTTQYQVNVFNISIEDVGETLEDCSWEIISALSQTGRLLDYFNIGDKKTITLNGQVLESDLIFDNFEVQAVLIGYNHNAELEGENLAHFQLGRIDNINVAFSEIENDYEYTYPVEAAKHLVMNVTNTNTGGWESSYMRSTVLGNDGEHTPNNPLEGSFMACLPADLRAVMCTCPKYTDNVGGNIHLVDYITATEDYLVEPSGWEIAKNKGLANNDEIYFQQQYQYYTDGNSTARKRHYSITTDCYSWLRSPAKNGNIKFCELNASGGVTVEHAYGTVALIPIFFV